MSKAERKPRKEFEAIAAKLPPISVPQLTKVKGFSLLANGQDFIEGKPVKPEKWYVIKRPMPVDHVHNLIHAYEKHGEEGITNYIKKVGEALKNEKSIRNHSGKKTA